MKAQTCISLQPGNLISDSACFNIESVIDKTKDTASIGTYINEWEESKQLNLCGGLQNALGNYLNEALPKREGQEQLTMVFSRFDLIIERSSIAEKTVRIRYELAFYGQNDSLQGEKLFEVKSYKDSVYNEYLAYLEIELEDFLAGFIAETVDGIISTFKENTVSGNSFVETPVFICNVPESLCPWTNMLTYNRLFSKYQKGWKITYYGYVDTPSKDYFIPYIFSYGMSKGDESSFTDEAIKSTDIYSFEPGTRFFIKLLPDIFVNVDLQVPIGWEAVKYTNGSKHNYFLYGVSAAQGVYFISSKQYGITFGANIYERFIRSKVTPNDIGFSLELGIKF